MEFFERPEDLNSIPKGDEHSMYSSKTMALVNLGFTGGARAEAFLRLALTEDGPEELADDWLHDVPGPPATDRPEGYHNLIRGRAAAGLVYTRKPENLELVRALYQELHQYVQANAGRRLQPNESFRHESQEEADKYDLYTFMVDAMASAEALEDEGERGPQQAEESKSGRPEDPLSKMRRLVMKYMFPYWEYE